eukprot:TRINITY_DN16742_c0_g1_i1.p1 TRINITY_DN16742_c0_g1~~TRINITY_DN16742_c0_g1_i1.p1  ORF type:complete len:450 (+),score=76.23 TRINITY_DN16742_c0_g1_i1:99-1352(+)
MDADLRTPKQSENSDEAWIPLSSWSHEGSIEDICEREGIVVDTGFAMDCGGSRVKIACFYREVMEKLPGYVVVEKGPSVPVKEEGRDGMLRYITLPTKKLPQFIEFCREHDVMEEYCRATDGIKEVIATGGGAWKFAPDMLDALSVKVKPLPEMQTLVDGLDFLLSHTTTDEVFEFDLGTKSKVFVNEPVSYPYMIVSIGSGVSIIKVTGPGEWVRVSGSCIGGGTYWGLSKLLTNVKTWDELQHLRQVENTVGDNKEVDLLVGDIYGGRGLTVLGLGSEVIASSFGKCGVADESSDHELGAGFKAERVMPQKKFRKTRSSAHRGSSRQHQFAAADLHRSLLLMIANNIGQIAYLNARLESIDKIYFTGGFTHNNPYIWSKLTYAINFWSKGTMQPRFLAHDGYLGALGALIHSKQQ